MGDVWKNGRNNDKNIWLTVSKRCVDVERQNMGVTTRERKTH